MRSGWENAAFGDVAKVHGASVGCGDTGKDEVIGEECKLSPGYGLSKLPQHDHQTKAYNKTRNES